MSNSGWTRDEIAKLEASLDRRLLADWWDRWMLNQPVASERREQAVTRAKAAKASPSAEGKGDE